MYTDLLFDNENEYIGNNFTELKFDVLFDIDFSRYSKRKCNDIIIELISNELLIIEKIDKIINHIKEEFSPTDRFIRINTEKVEELECLSIIFKDFYLRDSIESKVNKTRQKISSFKKDIKRINKDIKDYEMAIKNQYVVEDDEMDIIFEIEAKYHNEFSKEMQDIYNFFNDENHSGIYKNEKEFREAREKEEKYYQYIREKYSDIIKEKAIEYKKGYEEWIDELVDRKNEWSGYLSKYLNEEKTIYYDTYINFFEKLKYIISYVRYEVDAWYCINYEDESFNWYELSSERRLCLATMYNRPWKIGTSIPKCDFFYGIKEKNNITILERYATNKIIENKGNPFVNIANDFKDKNLIALEHYTCTSIEEIVNVLFYKLKLSNVQVNKCKNCGKYFIPTGKVNEKYCDRISPQNPNKTCKEFGVNKTYRDEMKSSPIKNEHNKISQAYRMRIRRAKTITEREQYLREFENYKQNYIKNRHKYKIGKIDEKDFLNWLESQKG